MVANLGKAVTNHRSIVKREFQQLSPPVITREDKRQPPQKASKMSEECMAWAHDIRDRHSRQECGSPVRTW